MTVYFDKCGLLPHQSELSIGMIRPVSSAKRRHHECRRRQIRKIGGKLSIMKRDVVGKSGQRRHVLHCLGIFHCPWWETERTDLGKRQQRKWILWTNRRVKHVHKAMVRQALLKIDPPPHTHTPQVCPCLVLVTAHLCFSLIAYGGCWTGR